MDRRAIKIGFYAFILVFLTSLVTLKPYLPTAVYHNFARIDDYHFFTNRNVEIEGQGTPLPISKNKLTDPSPETQTLLDCWNFSGFRIR